jgi:hypothetical protein
MKKIFLAVVSALSVFFASPGLAQDYTTFTFTTDALDNAVLSTGPINSYGQIKITQDSQTVTTYGVAGKNLDFRVNLGAGRGYQYYGAQGLGSWFYSLPTTYFFEFDFNSLDVALNRYVEALSNFATDTGGTLTYTLTNANNVSWDGTTLAATGSRGSGTFRVTSSKPFTQLTHDWFSANNFYVTGIRLGLVNNNSAQNTVPVPTINIYALFGLASLLLLVCGNYLRKTVSGDAS